MGRGFGDFVVKKIKKLEKTIEITEENGIIKQYYIIPSNNRLLQ